MSKLINKLEKRIYINKPEQDTVGQYSYGHVNNGETDSILGLRDSSYFISGSWEYAKTGDAELDYNDLFTLAEVWNNENLEEFPGGVLMSNTTYGYIPDTGATNEFRMTLNFAAFPDRYNWFIVNQDSPCYLHDNANNPLFHSYNGSVDCLGINDYWTPYPGGGGGPGGNNLAQYVYSSKEAIESYGGQAWCDDYCTWPYHWSYCNYNIGGVCCGCPSYSVACEQVIHYFTLPAGSYNLVFKDDYGGAAPAYAGFGSDPGVPGYFNYCPGSPADHDYLIERKMLVDDQEFWITVVGPVNSLDWPPGKSYRFDKFENLYNDDTEWVPAAALLPFQDGGLEAAWVDSELAGWWCVDTAMAGSSGGSIRYGLNPRYKMDFAGFPETFYDTENTYFGATNFFSGSMFNRVSNVRPISFVSSSFDSDLQSYYSGESTNDTVLRSLSSAPNRVSISFKLSDSTVNNIPNYIDINEEPFDDFDYWYFVVDWNWMPSDNYWGPDDNSPYSSIYQVEDYFPTTVEELVNLNDENLFVLKEIDDETQHDYITSGIKTIKVVTVTTMYNDIPDTDQWVNPYDAWVQAVNWNLVTIKLYLDDEGALTLSDYGDIGGDEFVFLPYPDRLTLQIFDEDGNIIHGYTPSGTTYKTSHPIISGLSEDSVYITSLEKLVSQDKYSVDEENERSEAHRAKTISPIGFRDEWGDFLGKTNISQVRLFNKPFDMANLLGINIIDDDDEDNGFHPYTDRQYWNLDGIISDELQAFPQESPVGDIFISEYNQFKESCLVEINCNKLEEKSFSDTSGNGNKGILIGDYSIMKEYVNQPASRDSYIRVPKLDKKYGAF